eukprot:12918684-Prorocentrum_lima.AAC.1
MEPYASEVLQQYSRRIFVPTHFVRSDTAKRGMAKVRIKSRGTRGTAMPACRPLTKRSTFLPQRQVQSLLERNCELRVFESQHR